MDAAVGRFSEAMSSRGYRNSVNLQASASGNLYFSTSSLSSGGQNLDLRCVVTVFDSAIKIHGDGRKQQRQRQAGQSTFESSPVVPNSPILSALFRSQVLLGDMGAGKSSLVIRFVRGQFIEFQESTIGAAFFAQTLTVGDTAVKFEIWDTAGQERYHSLAPMYYRGAAAAIIVYDMTSTESFEKAKNWVQELRKQGNPNMVTALAGNKCDLEDKRKVQTEVTILLDKFPCGFPSLESEITIISLSFPDLVVTYSVVVSLHFHSSQQESNVHFFIMHFCIPLCNQQNGYHKPNQLNNQLEWFLQIHQLKDHKLHHAVLRWHAINSWTVD
ncbi:hypothetical protein ZIOFF_025875 [Zingiber officinale]|uniref:Uncharacterized protein n=1 Tax=Zingiber officinale TaxID=94328 RepID=A0A8J5LK27_ZINOF|nr:hypothetical protein ZIOFF_025875 [Zingiber officinale]